MTKRKLKNGMRVILAPYDGTSATTILVLTKVGSRYEPANLWGASHYIEHMMFKGTKRRKTSREISQEIDRYGAEFNAYTGKDLTGYYVKIASDEFDVAVDLLSDMLFHSVYDAKEMAREKKVIIEEIKMYDENPIMHVEDVLENAMFTGTMLGKEIAGTKESMLAMKRSDVLKYRDAYYTPSEMVVVVSGKVPRGIMAKLEKKFGKRKGAGNPEAFDDVAIPRCGGVGRQFKPLKQIQLALGFPMVGRDHKDIPAIKLLAYILGGAMSSRLFIEVRERRGLCYMIRAKADAYQDVGTFVIRAGLDATRLPEAMKTILREVKKVKSDGVTAKELAHAKDHFAGAMKLRLEDSSARAEFYGRQELFLGKVLSEEAWLDRYQDVTRAGIKRVAEEVLEASRLSVAAIGPYKTDTALREALGVVA